MKKINITNFEEMISNDPDLRAKAETLAEEGGDLRDKVTEFAKGLGYELDFSVETTELDDDALDDVAGGMPEFAKNCDHNYVFYKSIPGRFWGDAVVYKCTKCGDTIFNKLWQ